MYRKQNSETKHESKICEFPPDSKSEELRTLVNDPRYVCMECGKTAASHENLCRPDRMFSSW
jgi:hypothetical protein